MTELLCHKHNRQLECLGGCSAHRDSWYCPECDQESEAAGRSEKIDKEQVIEKLWEDSGHGTRRQDIEAAYAAGFAACLELTETRHAPE